MAASVPTPVSPQTHEFILSIPEEVLLKILQSAKVKLSVPAHGILPRAELEKRVKLLLSDCQRLKEVLPLGSVSYTQLPEWIDGGMGDKSDKNQEGKESSSTDTLVDAFSSSIYTIKESLELQCMKDYMPELVEHQSGEHAFADLGYSLLGLAGGIQSLLDSQIADRAFFLQDKAQTSAIAISLVSLRGCSGDPTTPVLFVLFDHETRKHLVNTSSLVDVKTISATQRWVQSVLNGGQAIGCIDCPVNAQHLLLRQLLYNSRRLPTEIKSVFSRARRGPLVHFTASFIVPLRPVSPTALGYLSLPLCRAPCSAPKCPGTLGTGGICSGCSVTEYCSTACQSRDRARHAPECRRIASSKFVSFEPVPFGGSGRFESQITLSFNMTARDVIGNSKSQSPADQLKAGLAASRRKRPGGRLFVIKIQCGMGDRAPLMIYDQDRTFSFHLSHPGFLKMLGWSKDDSPGDKRDAEAFEALETLARNCTRWRGLKVFLWARHSRSSDARLEVLTEISPSQEIPW